MDALLFTDVAFESEESWGGFELVHGVTHQAVYDAMLQQSLEPFYLDLFSFPREGNQSYLLDHYQAHLSNAALLGLPDIPDLSSVDLADPTQRDDWLQLHALVHANENGILGLL